VTAMLRLTGAPESRGAVALEIGSVVGLNLSVRFDMRLFSQIFSLCVAAALAACSVKPASFTPVDTQPPQQIDAAAPPAPFLTKQMTSTTMSFSNIWGSGPGDIYITGDNDTILHSTGDGIWTAVNPTATGMHYKGIWGSSENDVYTLCADGFGGNPMILRSTGNGSWSPVAAPAEMLGIWGSAVDDIWAVGVNGTIRHSTGGNAWSISLSPTMNHLYSVWGTGKLNAYAVGSAGTILRWNGMIWSVEPSGSPQNFGSVWGTSASDVYATAADGTVLHSTGDGKWSSQDHTVMWVSTVWGSSSSDIYVVGGPNGASTTATGILHSEGNGTWAPVDPGTAIRFLRAVWGTGPNNVYFADYAGGVYHHP